MQVGSNARRSWRRFPYPPMSFFADDVASSDGWGMVFEMELERGISCNRPWPLPELLPRHRVVLWL